MTVNNINIRRQASTSAWGNGILEAGEAWDDSNTNNADGCDSICAIESGYTWDVSSDPSVCQKWGDGIVRGTEQWDDGNLIDNDGWDSTWNKETGYSWTGEPSVWNTVWGDSLKVGTEGWDDGGTVAGDGCSDTWTLETGWNWVHNNPTVCTEIWGDGTLFATSTLAWDDGNTVNNDGWANDWMSIETGWTWTGSPSVCTPIWGDGLLLGTETCDDNNVVDGEGCSSLCQIETGWTCDGLSPTSWTEIWGDNLLFATSTLIWDDGNTVNNDGWASDCMSVEVGWTWTGYPSTWTPICQDGLIRGTEQWDDNNNVRWDGCSRTCTIDAGWTWSATEPSVCLEDWGDNRYYSLSQLTCDDGNTISGDGWSNDWLTIETGYQCTGGSRNSAQTCFSTWGDSVKASDEPWDNGHG